MKAVIAGGTGALGRRVAADLVSNRHEVVVFTRSPRADLPFRQVRWDGHSVGDWAAELEGAVVINLAGELVDRRPTRANIELLRRSRVEPTKALVRASHLSSKPPALWLQGSTTAIYGDAGETVITEDATIPEGPPQMPGVAQPWEEAAKQARPERQVFFRLSLVLDNDMPVLQRLSGLVKWGLGGKISTGRQWFSWIHVEDMLRAVRFVVNRDIAGVVNVTSPCPVRNETLMTELRRQLRRPWSPPVPSPLVRAGAWLMGSDPALALTGRRCVPARLSAAGFDFRFPDIRLALEDLFGHAGHPRGEHSAVSC